MFTSTSILGVKPSLASPVDATGTVLVVPRFLGRGHVRQGLSAPASLSMRLLTTLSVTLAGWDHLSAQRPYLHPGSSKPHRVSVESEKNHH